MFGIDRDSPLVSDSLAQTVAVVGCIGQHDFGWQVFDQSIGLRRASFLASREGEADRASQPTHGHVDLGAQAAARTAKGVVWGLIFSPFFAPEACWWVRMMVESTIRYSKSGSFDTAAKMRHQIPLWLQRLKRRKTLFQSPNTSGRSRQGEPVRTIQSTASTNMRLSRPDDALIRQKIADVKKIARMLAVKGGDDFSCIEVGEGDDLCLRKAKALLDVRKHGSHLGIEDAAAKDGSDFDLDLGVGPLKSQFGNDAFRAVHDLIHLDARNSLANGDSHSFHARIDRSQRFWPPGYR